MLRSGLTTLFLLCAAQPLRGGEFIPNDPGYGPYMWYGPKLNMPRAWAIGKGSPDVTIAVIDTGVIAGTPELAGRILPAIATYPGLAAPYSDADMQANSRLHHGTWVASVAAAAINNGHGLAGVGEFTILPVVVTNTLGLNDSNAIADGIRIAADRGARVINVSQRPLLYGPLDDAAAYARSKGALVIAAAGNSAIYDPTLSGYDNLIFVSGTNPADGQYNRSTWGPAVDLSAPAESILVADGLSGYGLTTGTSVAAPLVAGAAALAWSINPDLTPDQVQSMLYSTAVDIGDPGWDPMFGWGRLDIGAVAEAALAAMNPDAGRPGVESIPVPEPGAMAMLAGVVCGRVAEETID